MAEGFRSDVLALWQLYSSRPVGNGLEQSLTTCHLVTTSLQLFSKYEPIILDALEQSHYYGIKIIFHSSTAATPLIILTQCILHDFKKP